LAESRKLRHGLPPGATKILVGLPRYRFRRGGDPGARLLSELGGPNGLPTSLDFGVFTLSGEAVT